MKARVKKTGKIVDVYEWSTLTTVSGDDYELEDVELIIDGENYIPDYWTKLEHQYAGMAMQGMIKRSYNAYCDDCANYENMNFEDAQALLKDHAEALADVCVKYAHALVEKMKEERK